MPLLAAGCWLLAAGCWLLGLTPERKRGHRLRHPRLPVKTVSEQYG